MDLSPSYFATIPADVRYDDNLVPNAKLLFGEITALCNKEGFCWAGNDYFADLYKVDNKTISRWISQLSKGGYLSVQILKKEGNKRKIFIGNSLHLLVTKSSLPSDEKVTTLVTKKSIASDEIVTSNIRINNTINNTMNREENALAFFEQNAPSEFENFLMRFRKKFTDQDWDKFKELFDCKAVEESLEFTTQKIKARLTRFALNYLENNDKTESKKKSGSNAGTKKKFIQRMKEAQNIKPYTKNNQAVVIDFQRGKIPPQSMELEESVLGAMFADAKSIDECMMIIKSADVFYKEANKLVFEAMFDLYSENHPIDLLTVGARLRTMNKIDLVGGDFYLMSLMQKMSSGAHIEIHSRLLQQFYIKRQLIRDASMMLSTAYDADKDCHELLSEWGSSLDFLQEQISSGRKNISYSEGLDLVAQRVEFLTNKSPEDVTGARTGFKVIDAFTGGYQPGELIVEAARPGMGKTAKMLKCALENARIGDGVGIISAEMSAVQLITRTVAIDTNFHLTQLTKKGFEKNDYFVTLNNHKHRMKNFPIHIDDTASPDIRTVVATARMWKRKYKIKILIVDYLQLLSDSSKSGNREQEIASISRKLKALAKELEIPVIALSQLSRAVESRGSSKRPMLSDLRESGAIEQDADMVSFIYRPEYYNIDVDDELLAIGANTEIIFAKYRGGAPGTTIGLHWQGDKTKFEDPADVNQDSHNVVMAELPKINPAQAFENYSIEDESDNGISF